MAQQKQRIAQLCARIDLIATSIKGKPAQGTRSHTLEGVEPDSDADVQDEGMISARLYAVLEQEVFRLRAELTGRDEHLEECQEYIQVRHANSSELPKLWFIIPILIMRRA